MRKVLFKKWIPVKYEQYSVVGINKRIPNTGCYEKEFSLNGLFHQWGLNIDYTLDLSSNYSVAIIETENGEIILANPEHIKFVDEPLQTK
jgi:hypothetical protein